MQTEFRNRFARPLGQVADGNGYLAEAGGLGFHLFDLPLVARVALLLEGAGGVDIGRDRPGYHLRHLPLGQEREGGLEAVERANVAKKERIYRVMDAYPDFFRGTVEPDSRSWMNITMRLPSEDLEKKFIAEAGAAGFVGLKGHRSVGGIRVSMYNAFPLEGAEKLAEFMEAFRKVN